MSKALQEIPPVIKKRHAHANLLMRNVRQYPLLYVMCSVGVVWFIIFRYIPMGGLAIAFQNFRLAKGLFGSKWVGFKNFIRFFNDPYCFRIIRNTFLIAFYSLIWGFPAPILLALSINELQNQRFKRVAQSMSYLPHFVSTVVVIGLLQMITASDGIINSLLVKPFTGGRAILFMSRPEWFRTLYVGSGIWQHVGWSSIIYLAAISGIDPQLYEAAKIDGAGRLQCIFRITLPVIMPTIKVLLILRMGQLFRVGFEKVYLMYSPATYETADVLSTYVYRVGILGGQDFSYAAAIGFFESMISLVMIVGANYMSKKISGEGIY